MLMTMSVTVFAEPGHFLQSPSKNSAPVLIEGTNESEDCTAEIVVTPYSERQTHDDEKRAEIEKAYNVIVTVDDLTSLNDDLADLVDEKEISSDVLAVSDLFDVSFYGCEAHAEHGSFRISLRVDTLKGFVSLLHFKDDEWNLIENATVEGDVLTFTVDDLSPFAIVVERAPQTGDEFNGWIYIVLMIVSAAALAVVGFKLRKAEN